MPPHFYRPYSCLESESDWQAYLPMRAPGHHRIAVFCCQPREIGLDLLQFSSDDLSHPSQYERGPGIGDILYGRAVVEPLSAVARATFLECADQTQCRVIGGLKPCAYFLKAGFIEFYSAASCCHGFCSVCWNQAKLRLGFSQFRQECQPRIPPRYIIRNATP